MNGRVPVERHPGFTLVRIAGRPYERGLQHGRLAELSAFGNPEKLVVRNAAPQEER